MPRLPVPEDYESDHISVAGVEDHHYENGADVNTDAVDHARDLSVREDEDCRYVGPSRHYIDEVAAFLGVDWTEGDPEAPSNDADETETSSAEEETTEESSDAEPESVTDLAEQVEAGDCPWCDEYSGDGVPQHAGSAHPEEWSAYTEARDA